jgi:hypothetical protein
MKPNKFLINAIILIYSEITLFPRLISGGSG